MISDPFVVTVVEDELAQIIVSVDAAVLYAGSADAAASAAAAVLFRFSLLSFDFAIYIPK